MRYDGEIAYHRYYNASKELEIVVAYNFDYNTRTGAVAVKGISEGEFENCICGMGGKFKVYP
jgi:hypothetical protein